MSWLARVYTLVGCGLLSWFVVHSTHGWEWDSSEPEVLPASARQSPGGYRSFHFWHSGFHGGK